jgi:myosin heavy subunit
LQAYPTRIPYEVIHGRYAPLMGQEVLDCTGDEPAAFCEAVAQACDVAPRDYALGITKLFLKAGCGGFLEDLASMDVAVVVPLLVRKIAESKRKKGKLVYTAACPPRRYCAPLRYSLSHCGPPAVIIDCHAARSGITL